MKNKILSLYLLITFTSLLFCNCDDLSNPTDCENFDYCTWKTTTSICEEKHRFTPVYLYHTVNPYNSMGINITSATIDGIDLEAGDEIGLFDGQLCVGATVVTETISTNNIEAINASKHDPTTTEINGFNDGNPIIFRIWDSSAGKEGIVPLDGINYLQGEGIYSQLNSAYVELTCSAGDLANKNMAYPENFQLKNVYPNPFNPTTNITYELSENSNVKMEIYDLSGKLISSLVNKFQPLGLYSINWNAKSQPSGIYILQLTTNDLVETQKITYVK